MTWDGYRLVGGAGDEAVAKGLAGANWYRSSIPRPLVRTLIQRSDAPAIRDTLVWYALVVAAGASAVALRDTAWFVAALLVYGTLYAGPADSRWHEAGHGTPFRTAWMNRSLYQVASFQVMRRPTVWRWSHARHHADTLIKGRDPEIQVKLPVRPLRVFLDFFGFALAPAEFVSAVLNACGYISPEEKTLMPEAEWKKVVREGRCWTLAFLVILGSAIFWDSWLPLLLLGLPSVYGAWLYNFFGMTQHACLPENVLDHRLNSRTVLMNPLSRFLYWNMNYHVEHHMYPMVPYHALPLLHDLIKADCPKPCASLWEAYREVIPALYRQWLDPAYHVQRTLPQPASPHLATVIHAGS